MLADLAASGQWESIMKLVSVIIPTRNSAAYLERCLVSIKEQTYPQIEIIVVDNHSTDNTPEIAARFGKVITAGPERSAQCNQGALQARGDYLYRVDGDFILDPDIVAACVSAIEDEQNDIVAVPNRSVGESYWARVRQLERDTYLDDDLIVAARFWRREAFETTGGFDELLVSCEDYDLHYRMVQAGYQLGRIEPAEIHLGEPDSLWAHIQKSFYYGPSAWRYLRKNPSHGIKQFFPLRASYWRHRADLIRHPTELLGLIALKLLHYGAAGLSITLNGLGLLNESGRFSSITLGGLIVLLVSIAAFLNLLPRYGILPSGNASIALVILGFTSWLTVGKRRSKTQDESLQVALATVSICYTPYLLLFALGNYLSQEAWLYTFSFLNALIVGVLVYFSKPKPGSERWVPWALGVVAAVFIGFFSFRLAGQLSLRTIISHEIISIDQGLWATANGIFPGGQILSSSILEKSLFSEVAAPVLLFYLPLYMIGLGGPFLLLVSQVLFTGLISISLYRLGENRLGKSASFFLTLAFLVYFMTPRLVDSSFQPEIIGIAAMVFGLSALDRNRTGLYFLLMLFAVISGENVAIAVAFLGVVVFFWNKDRWTGIITLCMGVISAWILMFVFRPYFGGVPFRLPSFDGITETAFWIDVLSRYEIKDYLILLFVPLGLLPLLGLLWLLPALPMVYLNILYRQINFPGSINALITVFLFIALIFGFAWAARKISQDKRSSLLYSGVVFVFIMSLLSGIFLNGDLYKDLLRHPFPSEAARGNDVLDMVPVGSSLATESSTALLLAHRAELDLLPKIEDAQYVLVDLFSPVDQLQGEQLPTIVEKLFNNPIYGIKAESGGVILFERGADSSQDIDILARVDLDEIDNLAYVILDNTVVYRGYSVDSARVVPGQPFVITTYWESIATVDRPYLVFTAYPGGQQFQDAVYGLYPTAIWQPGDLVRHCFSITMPELPPGEEYEIVVGLWFDTGEHALTEPSQLLGEDVVRIAKIIVTGKSSELQSWSTAEGQ